MVVRYIVFVLLVHQVVLANNLALVRDTPVSNSMKNILRVLGSERVRNISQDNGFFSGVTLIKNLQLRVKSILATSKFSVADIRALEEIISKMKVELIGLEKKQVSAKNAILQELCIDAVSMMHTLKINDIDQDISYIKDVLLEQCHGSGIVNYKASLRVLAIIEDFFRRYDGVLISAYTVLVLSQVAVIEFLMNVM